MVNAGFGGWVPGRIERDGWLRFKELRDGVLKLYYKGVNGADTKSISLLLYTETYYIMISSARYPWILLGFGYYLTPDAISIFS